jgi:hypothetical protein
VVDAKTVAHCHSLINDALAQGAVLLAGGETSQNVVMPAHLVDKVTPAMKLFRDESFGPVVGIIRAATRPMRSSWPMTPNMAFPPPSSPATRRRGCAWPARSAAASAISTAPPCMTRRRCPSAGWGPAAMALWRAAGH